MSVMASFRLDGLTAVVTGASSGLGAHLATVLAQAGADLVLAARKTERLAPLQARIGELGRTAHARALDVTDASSVADFFASLPTVARVIVNNAGVTTTASVLEQREADWDAVLDTNLKGAWLVAQQAAKAMIAAGVGGSIVNVASILGERVAGSVAPYCASKAGLLQLTRSLALELARYDIRANALMPGYVATDLNRDFLASASGDKLRARIPTRRFGELSDLDGPMLLLASPAGRHMTGACLAVDGGHLVSSL